MENAIFPPFLLNLLTSGAIGLIVGLEREFNTHREENHVGGIRTFPMVAILGYLSGWLSAQGQLQWVLPVVLAGFIVIQAVVYHFQVAKGQAGQTTEMAMIITLLLGTAVSMGFVKESLEVVVLITALLSVKAQMHGLIEKITQDELFAFIKFIILVLLALPLLPDQNFGPEGLMNFKELGWIVIIVLSINFTGYLLLKFGGARRGILLTAFVGGLFSSTMVAWVFSARSKEKPELSAAYSAGIILSSTVMFARVYALSAIFFYPVAVHLFFPLLSLLMISLGAVYMIARQQKDASDNLSLNPGNPLDMKNAAFFAILYITISLIMYYSRQWLNRAGVYGSGAISGMAEIDAITISTVKWSSADVSRAEVAANIVLIAVLSNTVFKCAMSMLRGTAPLRRWVALGFGSLLVAGAAWLAFML